MNNEQSNDQTSHRLIIVAYLLTVALGVVVFFPAPDPTTSSILETSAKTLGYIAVMSAITLVALFVIEGVRNYVKE